MSEPDPAQVAAAAEARSLERASWKAVWRAQKWMMLVFGILGPCIAFGTALALQMVARENIVLFVGPAVIVVLANVAFGLNPARRGGSPFFLGICLFACASAGCYSFVLFPMAVIALFISFPLGLLGFTPVPAFWTAASHAIQEVEKLEWRLGSLRATVLLFLGVCLPIALPCGLHTWAVSDADRLLEAWKKGDAREIERAQAALRRSGWILSIPDERIEDPVTASRWPGELSAPLTERLESARARHPVTVALFGLDMGDLTAAGD